MKNQVNDNRCAQRELLLHKIDSMSKRAVVDLNCLCLVATLAHGYVLAIYKGVRSQRADRCAVQQEGLCSRKITEVIRGTGVLG